MKKSQKRISNLKTLYNTNGLVIFATYAVL